MNSDLDYLEKDLKTKDFTINDQFLDAFLDPIPPSLIKYIFIAFILFTLFNVLALIIISYYYWYKPKKVKQDRPKSNIASSWFHYAEKNSKYKHYKETIEGYKKAIDLDPNNVIYKLKYYEFLAGYSVRNKTPATGKPIGLNVEEIPNDFYSDFKFILLNYMNESKMIPLENSKIFGLASWLSFDNKLYEDSLLFGEYSIKINEFSLNKKDILEEIDLLYLLAGANFYLMKPQLAINYIIKGLSKAINANHKPTISKGWEFLGECYYQSDVIQNAERLFLLAERYDKRRWISIYRLYWIYKKKFNIPLEEKYKRKYIQLQKDLGPI